LILLIFMVRWVIDLLLPDSLPTEPATSTSATTVQTTPTNSVIADPIPSDDTIPATTPTTVPPATTVPVVTEPVVIPGPALHDPNADFSVGAVDPSWFDNVLFIGDSRTVGLRDYARSGNAEYFCSVGMSVFNFNSRTASDKNFSDQKLEKLLKSRTYDKIFISLGINECGYPLTTLMNAYTDLVNMVRQYQPDAKIILQGIMSVSRSYAKNGSSFSPSNINKINDEIRALADGSTIFYIDVNEFFADEEGYLIKEVSGDGCHPNGKYYGVWANWIAYAVGQIGI
jgi:lysophospholipase L1-like esterase